MTGELHGQHWVWGCQRRGVDQSGFTAMILVFLKNKFIYLFIFACVGSLLLRAGFSLVAASGGYFSLRRAGFSLRWLLLLQSTGSRHTGFSSCGTQAQ